MTASRRALAHVHTVAGDLGISHANLRLWAIDKGYESTKDVPDEELDKLARYLRDHPEEADRFLQTYWCVNAPSLIQEVPLFTPEQQAALDADADRIQARFRALERADF